MMPRRHIFRRPWLADPLLIPRVRTTSSKLIGLGELKMRPKISPMERGIPIAWEARTQMSMISSWTSVRHPVVPTDERRQSHGRGELALLHRLIASGESPSLGKSVRNDPGQSSILSSASTTSVYFEQEASRNLGIRQKLPQVVENGLPNTTATAAS
jgi:hypothetical protein